MIEKNEKEIQISVWNSSLVKHEELPAESGLGLENIAKRLELLFPENDTSVQLTNAANGTTVLAIFPYVLKSEI
jgi:LytS/YehU family sensor histidine kinase